MGGPFTRFDPSCPNDMEKWSCIDLVLISVSLLPYVESILIDSKKEFSPIRPISKVKWITSDHFPIIVTFKNLPLKNTKKTKIDNFTIWNTNKSGGWTAYENLTSKDDIFANICNDEMNNCLTLPSSNDDIFDNICNDEMNDLVTESSTEAMDKLSKVI